MDRKVEAGSGSGGRAPPTPPPGAGGSTPARAWWPSVAPSAAEPRRRERARARCGRAPSNPAWPCRARPRCPRLADPSKPTVRKGSERTAKQALHEDDPAMNSCAASRWRSAAVHRRCERGQQPVVASMWWARRFFIWRAVHREPTELAIRVSPMPASQTSFAMAVPSRVGRTLPSCRRPGVFM